MLNIQPDQQTLHCKVADTQTISSWLTHIGTKDYSMQWKDAFTVLTVRIRQKDAA